MAGWQTSEVVFLSETLKSKTSDAHRLTRVYEERSDLANKIHEIRGELRI